MHFFAILIDAEKQSQKVCFKTGRTYSASHEKLNVNLYSREIILVPTIYINSIFEVLVECSEKVKFHYFWGLGVVGFKLREVLSKDHKKIF